MYCTILCYSSIGLPAIADRSLRVGGDDRSADKTRLPLPILGRNAFWLVRHKV